MSGERALRGIAGAMVLAGSGLTILHSHNRIDFTLLVLMDRR